MSLDQSEHGEAGALQRLLRRLIVVRPEEFGVVLWCWLYIFAVLSSYYIMRPIRDQMGVAGGVNNLPWLFTGTLIGMLVLNLPFAWLVKKLPRSRFIPLTYRFFALNILLFAVALLFADQEQTIWVGRIFFIWASIYNLFVVSVFWQLNVDLFSPEQGKRLFGFIAAGATIGAIVGSVLQRAWRAMSRQPFCCSARPSCSKSRCSASAAWRVCRRRCTGSPTAAPNWRHEQPIGGGMLAGIINAVRSPYLLGVSAVYAAVRDHLDLPLFPAGRDRQPELLPTAAHKPRSSPPSISP